MTNVNEIWLPVKNYEGYYEVSNLGNIRSLDKIQRAKKNPYFVKGKPIKSRNHPCGYKMVNLWRLSIRNSFLVHRLVANAFIPNPNNYPQINHKDGNKKNNIVENLEWCNNSINVTHALNTGLNKRRVKLKDTETGIVYESITNAAKELNINLQTFRDRLIGRSKIKTRLIRI